MSTPTTRPGNGVAAPGATDDVPSYVAAVRARLDDLPAEEVEELTGGLEADLAEALAGFDETPRQRFGDPAAYADELRAAADLPPRRVEPPTGLGPALAEVRGRLVGSIDDHLEALRRLPWFAPVRDFLLAVRPAWWVLRAWVAVTLLRLSVDGRDTSGLVGGFGWLLVLLLAIVASVVVGRRSPPRRTSARAALLVANVLAVICLPLVVDEVSDRTSQRGGPTVLYELPPGLWLNGVEVTNILPFDSQGRPLTGVQLFDDQGRPIEIAAVRPDGDPARSPSNVFPRPTSPGDVPTPGAPTASATPPGASTPSAGPSSMPPTAEPTVTPTR